MGSPAAKNSRKTNGADHNAAAELLNAAARLKNEAVPRGIESDDDFETIKAQWMPDCKRIAVRKYDEKSGRWIRHGSYPADICNEDYIQQTWGGGVYRLFLVDDKGDYLLSAKRDGRPEPAFTVQVADPPGGLVHPNLRNAAPAPEAAATQANNELEMLRRQMERQHQMMLEMVASMRQPGNQTPITELVTALVSLQNVLPKPAPSLPEKLMDRMFEVMAAGAGGGESRDSWLGFARDVMHELPAMLAAVSGGAAVPTVPTSPAARPAPESVQPGATVLPVTGSVPAANPPAEVAEEEMELTVDMGAALAFLKDQCRRGIQPEATAALIQHQAETSEDFADWLDDLLAQPLDAITGTDPELQMPGYKVWFTKLYEHLRQLAGVDDSARRAGNGGNPA